MQTVDRRADRAARHQVADELRAMIEGGLLAPGELLPSPPQIAKDTGVSVGTARAAVTILAHEGLVQVVPKVGAVVQGEQPVRPVQLGGPARVTAVMPSAVQRQELDIPSGVPLLRVETERDGELLIEQHLADRTVLVIGEAG
jgi:DNA-binding GntR family transcriptional regulator